MGIAKTCTSENMGTTVRILSLGGTEPDIHLGGNLPLPPIATYVCKKSIAILGLLSILRGARIGPRTTVLSGFLEFTQKIATVYWRVLTNKSPNLKRGLRLLSIQVCRSLTQSLVYDFVVR